MGDLLWRSTRGGQRVDLARTFHLVDLSCYPAGKGERRTSRPCKRLMVKGDLRWRSARGGQRVDLARTFHLVDLSCYRAGFRHRVAIDHRAAANGTGDFAAGNRDAANILDRKSV